MEIHKLNTPYIWDDYIRKQSGSFLQSTCWADFQKNLGFDFWLLAAQDQKNSVGAATLVIKRTLPFGKNYLYIPHGPVFSDSSALKFLLKQIYQLAIKQNSVFLKIEPYLSEKEEELRNILKEMGFKKSSKEIQPQQTIVLDLSKSERELLKSMKPKTRYNIKLAEKRGVKIRPLASSRDFEFFWNLMQETARRNKFKIHPKEHFEKLFELKPVKIYFAEYQGEILAAALIAYWSHQVIFLHGASSNILRNLMAPYLLHFEIIKKAKADGFREYDFYSFDEKKWSGFSRFKSGFGGEIKKYPGSFDLVFNHFWYILYLLAQKLRF